MMVMVMVRVTHSLTPVDSVFDSLWTVRWEYVHSMGVTEKKDSDRCMLGVDDVDGAADDDDVNEDLLPGLPHKVPW